MSVRCVAESLSAILNRGILLHSSPNKISVLPEQFCRGMYLSALLIAAVAGSLVPAELGKLTVSRSRLQELEQGRMTPTCVREAIHALSDHCRTIDTDLQTPDKICFAIKLTLCELEMAEDVPRECMSSCTYNPYPCVRALETRPQWWTSFSGNLRDAALLCHAARHEVEKDQLLDLYRNVSSLQSELFQGLQKEHERFKDALTKEVETMQDKTHIVKFGLDDLGQQMDETFKEVTTDGKFG